MIALEDARSWPPPDAKATRRAGDWRRATTQSYDQVRRATHEVGQLPAALYLLAGRKKVAPLVCHSGRKWRARASCTSTHLCVAVLAAVSLQVLLLLVLVLLGRCSCGGRRHLLPLLVLEFAKPKLLLATGLNDTRVRIAPRRIIH